MVDTELPRVTPTRAIVLNGGFTQVAVQCPFCGHEHVHGSGNEEFDKLPGPRESHCADRNKMNAYWVEKPCVPT
jgi:transposase-like protein